MSKYDKVKNFAKILAKLELVNGEDAYGLYLNLYAYWYRK